MQSIRIFVFLRNILRIESESEIKEFIGSLLDLSIPKNKNFLAELIGKLKKPSMVADVKVYVKPKIVEETSNKFNKNKNPTPTKNENEEAEPKKGGFSLNPTDNKKITSIARLWIY